MRLCAHRASEPIRRSSTSRGQALGPGSSGEVGLAGWTLPTRVRVGLEVEVAPPPVRDVRVQLGGGEVGVAEHLLDAAEVGAALEQVRCEGVPQQVRVDAPRLEPGLLCEAAQDQEGAGAGERAALCVEEQLGPVAAVEVTDGRGPGSDGAPRSPRGRSGRRVPSAPCRPRAPACSRDRRRRARGPPPRSRGGRRRRGARRGRRHGAPAGSSRRPRRSAARPRPGESVRGSVRRRRGRSSSAAGLSGRAPSSCWCR